MKSKIKYFECEGYEPLNTTTNEKVDILRKVSNIYEIAIGVKDEIISMLRPQAQYAIDVLQSPTCYTMTEVAKSMSLTTGELIDLLIGRGIIYRKQNNALHRNTYMLYAPYLKRGLEAYRTTNSVDLANDTTSTRTYLVWTERGKQFIHGLLK